MAISTATEYSAPLFTFTAEDTDSDATLELVDGTSGVLYTVYADNTGNTSTQVYVKLYNATATANVTFGTTAPHYILPVAAGATKQFCFPDGLGYDGLVVATGTSGGTEGTSGPTNAVVLRIGLVT
tara:strand:+ start:6563 stop:6940 length:378 start_codon:yes stop_codon:yes gene_type:complete